MVAPSQASGLEEGDFFLGLVSLLTCRLVRFLGSVERSPLGWGGAFGAKDLGAEGCLRGTGGRGEGPRFSRMLATCEGMQEGEIRRCPDKRAFRERRSCSWLRM